MNCNEILNDFIKYVFDELSKVKQIKVSRLPKVILTQDKSQTSTLAHFDTQNIEIVVYVKDRLLADVCRSLAHEIVHFFQLEKNELYNNAGDTGSEIENEANSLAGIIMRNYSKIHPEILVTPYTYTKKSTPTLSGDIPQPNFEEINKKLEEEIKSIYNELLVNTGTDIDEPKKEVHDYGCLMLQLNIPKWETILSKIDDEDLYTEENDSSYGKEHEPHVTVLYGFTENTDVDKIEKILQTLKKPVEVTFTKIDLFENDQFDVVKFNVESKMLNKLHDYFKSNFENEDKYPTYQPHATIAYVKKGMGKKYVKRLKEPVTLTSDIFKYSKQNGDVIYIEPYNVDRPLMECDCEEYDVPDDDFDKTVDWLKGVQQNGQLISEAEYHGKKVLLNKPMRGDVKKFKVYVKGKDGRVVKVNFGSKDYNIKKNNPDRKKSYCSRSKGIEGGGKDKTKANYWSRRAWNC